VSAEPIPALPRLKAAPTRQSTLRHRVLALALSFAWLAAHLAIYGVRSDFATLSFGYVAAEIVLPFVLGLASLVVALQPGRSGLGLGIGVASTLALLAPLLFGLVVSAHPSPRAVPPADTTWIGAVLCFDLTLVWAAVPLVFAALALRHVFPVAVSWRSALVGVASGLFSAGVMNLHCANVARFHMTLGHAVPAIIATVVGAALLSRAARV
jgi:hypothetical protein